MIHYVSATGPGDAWVVNELEIVRRAGIPFQLHALRAPSSSYHASDWGRQLAAGMSPIYPLTPADCLAILLAPVRFRSAFLRTLFNALFGRRESLRNRLVCLLHLFVACAWATRLKKSGVPVTHIHSQWIHSPGSVAWYGSWLLGVTFSFTGHAADLYRERVALSDKIRHAKFICCISEYHRTFFLQQGARPEQLRLVYCGIDVSRFQPATPRVDSAARPEAVETAGRASAGSAECSTLRIRSSGRLVEKKGFSDLIDACHLLRKQGISFECVFRTARTGLAGTSLPAEPE
jgi:colanic acid/amylovoran biosynthesis glycosyltransferase